MVGFQFYFMAVYVFVSDSLVVQSSTVIILLMVRPALTKARLFSELHILLFFQIGYYYSGLQ